MLHIGLRNNNPLNIRKTKEVWVGEKVPLADPNFKQFESVEYGHRAAFVNLGTYNSRGWNTIRKSFHIGHLQKKIIQRTILS